MAEPTWSTACPDWKRRIRERRSLIPFSPLFPAAADAKMAGFTSLRIVDLPGAPTIGESCAEWMLDFAATVFGAYDPETGQQLIREFMLLVSKKNTKSTIAAGLMLTELICGWRESDENLILAPTKEVADNSFKPAVDMIRADEELNDLLHHQDHMRLITNRATRATLKVVAADSSTVSGKKASRVLVDELWLFGKRADADAMLQEATGGQVSRPEGYTLYLTTQSDDPPAGVFKEKLAYYRGVRDGKITDRRKLPVLYEFPDEMVAAGEHLRPENFYVTNPNLGKSVSQTWLQEKFAEVAHKTDGSKQVFYAKHLNVEIGLGLRTDAWVGARYWLGAARALELRDLLERCEVLVVGLDGGGMDDLFGLTVLGREAEEVLVDAEAAPEEMQEAIAGKKRIKRWLSWSRAWAHRIVLERRKSIASRLEDFERDGDLTILEDDAIEAGWPADIAGAIAIIQLIKDEGLLCCVAADPAGLGEMIDALDEIDIKSDNRATGCNYVIGVQQGFGLMNAIKTAERKLANRTLLHAPQGLMDWAVGNLKIEPTAPKPHAPPSPTGPLAGGGRQPEHPPPRDRHPRDQAERGRRQDRPRHGALQRDRRDGRQS